MKINSSQPLRIVFLSCKKKLLDFRDDPSYIYRCENLGAALSDAGHEVRYMHVSQVSWNDAIDIAVFHRPSYSWYFRLALAIFNYRRICVVADVDDFIFNPDFALFSPGVINGKVTLNKTKQNFKFNKLALSKFKRITVSTVPLAKEIKCLIASSYLMILPNAVHHQWRIAADEPTPLDGRIPVMTYMPGTRSHDRDFVQMSGPLIELLRRHENMKLAVTGFLDFNLPARVNQVVHYDKKSFGVYHESVRAGWVNLAPLEDSPFTRCKSAIKVIEAGYWNIPTVCSPLQDAERFKDAGALIAKQPEEWIMLIEKLFLQSDFYRMQAEGLRSRMLEKVNIHTIAQQWLKFMMETVD